MNYKVGFLNVAMLFTVYQTHLSQAKYFHGIPGFIINISILVFFFFFFFQTKFTLAVCDNASFKDSFR